MADAQDVVKICELPMTLPGFKAGKYAGLCRNGGLSRWLDSKVEMCQKRIIDCGMLKAHAFSWGRNARDGRRCCDYDLANSEKHTRATDRTLTLLMRSLSHEQISSSPLVSYGRKDLKCENYPQELAC